MKYVECPICGAHLDYGETCDCETKKDTAGDAAVSSIKKSVKAIDENSIAHNENLVNGDVFRLKEVRQLAGTTAVEISNLVKTAYPKWNRQIMCACESPEDYGCLPHPRVVELICNAYGVKLDDKPAKRTPAKRKLQRKITLRMTDKDFEWLISQVERDDYPSVQAWLYAKLKEMRGMPS